MTEELSDHDRRLLAFEALRMFDEEWGTDE
jgi:hypothetical protein